MLTYMFKCPKCGFVQEYANMCADTGEVVVAEKEVADRPCPNDGETLYPIFDEDALQ